MSELDLRLWSSPRDGEQSIPDLIAKGADPNRSLGELQETAVHRACVFKNLRALELLLDHGGRVDLANRNNQTPLHVAAFHGALDLVDVLTRRGADVEARSDFGSPLDAAAYGGSAAVVALLLDRGADISARSIFGRTALHQAASGGNLEAARVLLRRGIEINSVDVQSNGTTALHVAVGPGMSELFRLIVTYGIELDRRNDWGATALLFAAR